MAWDDELTPEQRDAASSHDGHSRVLAGPGTGKTYALKARVQYLMDELRVEPSRILILTFTRKAVAELRARILPCIPEGNKPPRISTLHGFALRQLLRNSNLIEALPDPLRIADDWEEITIIIPDLKRLLETDKKSVRAALDAMSSDWDTLNDAELNVDPKFIAAWRYIRNVYGFTLRAEMVYRLKRAMEQHEKFRLEGQFEHVIIDEFQDLNACDLAVVQAISMLGASIFCAGDDDQSIYGFRKASPAGIRAFIDNYAGSLDHKITLCKRCDSDILKAAEFVADQDLDREPKDLVAENQGGIVLAYSASDQFSEARLIATACQQLHEMQFNFPEMAILLRSDYLGRFSEPIINELHSRGVPVSRRRTTDPLSEPDTRRLFALIQLAVSPEDSLATRALLQLTPGIGIACIKALETLAIRRGERFSETTYAILKDETLLPTFGARVAAAWKNIEIACASFNGFVTVREGFEHTFDELRSALSDAASILSIPEDAVDNLIRLAGQTDTTTLTVLMSRVSSVSEGLEPQLSEDSVNIMTMHQAKGLTFDCVLIPCLEDDLMPGNYSDPEEEGDERRLLYVSMTRARHALILFHAMRRKGSQAHSGRGPSSRDRSFTRFLSDYKFKM